MCVCICVSTSSLQLKANTEYIVFFYSFFNNYISHASREWKYGRAFASMYFLFTCIGGVPDTYLETPFEHFHDIWLNTSAIFLSDAKLTTRVRLITHETSGIRSLLSPRAIYYYTLQRRYIQGIYTILARPTPP